MIDPLEERQLLSVSPSPDQILVNETTSNTQYTTTARSIATDADGDTVIAWTRVDTVYDPDSDTTVSDSNIYARYLTNEIQRVTLTSGIETAGTPGTYGKFALIYGDSVVSTLSITASTPAMGNGDTNSIAGAFKLTFGTQTTGDITFTEFDFNDGTPGVDPALNIQSALRALGGPLENAVVKGIDPHTYQISYKVDPLAYVTSTATNPEIGIDQTSVVFTAGYLPAVQITLDQTPSLVGGYVNGLGDIVPQIAVSSDNPANTALAIQNAFARKTETTLWGPVEAVPASSPESTTAPVVSVTVSSVQTTSDPNGLRTFDITFTGDAGKAMIPTMQFGKLVNSTGAVLSKAAASCVITKQSSPEFRVNPEEPDNPFTIGPDKTDQTDPTVAIDSDGEFVIAWTSAVPDDQTTGSVTDIYARRFEPVGITTLAVPDQILAKDVQRLTFDASSVPPTGLTGVFRLMIGSQTTVNIYFDSNDLGGTATRIQESLTNLGYQGTYVTVIHSTTPTQFQFDVEFNGQRPSGTPPMIEYLAGAIPLPVAFSNAARQIMVTAVHALKVPSAANLTRVDDYTFRVNTLTANAQGQPSIAMNASGDFAIGWSSTGQNMSFFNGIYVRRFTADGKPVDVELLMNDEDANEHRNPYVAFSNDGHMAAVWESYTPLPLYGNKRSVDVDAKVYDAQSVLVTALYHFGGSASSGASNPTVAFDRANNFLFTWDQQRDNDNIPEPAAPNFEHAGVYARLYGISGNIIQDTFRVNSAAYGTSLLNAGLTPDSATTWPGAQYNSQAAIDADGDITVSYQGFGPDASENAFLSLYYYNDVLAKPENADLLPYFSSWNTQFAGGDVDAEVESVLIAAESAMLGTNIGSVAGSVTSLLPIPVFSNTVPSSTSTTYMLLSRSVSSSPLPSTPFSLLVDNEQMQATAVQDYTAEVLAAGYTVPAGTRIYMCTVERAQNGTSASSHSLSATVRITPTTMLTPEEIANKLGRMRAILDSVVGLLRGEANGVMYTQYDAQPTAGPTGVTVSDAVANATRDGSNMRFLIEIDNRTADGYFVLRLVNYNSPADTYEDITITPVIVGGPTGAIDIEKTRKAIDTALQTAARVGKNWPVTADWFTYEGPIDVRTITQQEIDTRKGTEWDLNLSSSSSNTIIYEVTFQGEVHDTWMGLALAEKGNHLVQRPVAEEQMLTFTSATPGLIALSMDTTTGDDFMFNPSNAQVMADSLEAKIQALAKENDKLKGLDPEIPLAVTVIPITGSNGLQYKVVFGGRNAGIDQFAIGQGKPKTTPVQGDPTTALYTGVYSSSELVKGATPPCDDPTTPVHTYANDGTLQGATLVGLQGNTIVWRGGASLGMQPNGTFSMVWTQYDEYSAGAPANQNIYFRTMRETTDTAGPQVTGIVTPDGTQVIPNGRFTTADGLTHMVITFDEDMYSFPNVDAQLKLLGKTRATADAQTIADCQKKWDNSVINPDNYRLLRDGSYLRGAVVKVEYGMNKAADLASAYGLNVLPTNKYEAILTFDSTPTQPGIQSLPIGNYTIQVTHPVASTQTNVGQTGLMDKNSNSLNHSGYVQGGADFSMSFSVVVGTGPGSPGAPDSGGTDTSINATKSGTEINPVVANSADGSYVIVWARFGLDGDGATDGNIIAQRFTASGAAAGPEFIVNSYTTGSQIDPDVAMDANGGFVVTWSGQGKNGDLGIFARAYDSTGRPQGDEFRVAKLVPNTQNQPAVAVNATGAFIITWTSYNQDNSLNGRIYGRCYDSSAQPLGNEFLVGSTGQAAERSDVTMADNGNSIVVWQSYASTANGWDIHAQRLDAAGNKLGGEFLVNASVLNAQSDPRVSMDANGDFVAVWQSYAQDGNGWGVFGRRFNAAGTALDIADFQVNQTITYWQYQPDVALDHDGNFTVVWTTFGQDDAITKDYGIYARMYLSNGTDYIDTATGRAVGEFRVNATTRGDQVTPSVCRNADNSDYIVGWGGPDSAVTGTGTGIFARRLDPPVETVAILPENPGPTISGLVVVKYGAGQVLTWAVADPHGIASVSLEMDGTPITAINGPYGTKYAANYSSILNLASGNHTYTIHATDAAGSPVATLSSGSFEVVAPVSQGPTISNIVTFKYGSGQFISWTTADTDGVASVSLEVDGTAVTSINGPYGTKYAANYSSILSGLTTGSHTFVIRSTDSTGALATPYSGSFEFVAAVGGQGPTITNAVAVKYGSGQLLTWAVADPDGIASTTLKVDGNSVGSVNGPYGTKYAANYSSILSGLASGAHTYEIQATDSAGSPVSTFSGAFDVAASAPVNTVGPAIANVVATEFQGNGDGVLQAGEKILITWSLTDPDGIYSTSALIGSTPAKAQYGPFGVNYSAVFDPQTVVGSYAFVVRASDNSSAHTQSEYSGTLSVAQVKSAFFASAMGSTNSAKTDWLVDLDGLTSPKSQSTSIIDAALAAS